MHPLTLARILFVLWMINEVFVILRSTPEERARVQLPRLAPLAFLLLFLPLFLALDYPTWLGWGLVIVQGLGLGLELAGEFQLLQAKSFSIIPDTPSQPQTQGLYRFLENPIYVGIIIQLAAWTFWIPIALIGTYLHFDLLRRMVSGERKHLESIDFRHRGIDSGLWN